MNPTSSKKAALLFFATTAASGGLLHCSSANNNGAPGTGSAPISGKDAGAGQDGSSGSTLSDAGGATGTEADGAAIDSGFDAGTPCNSAAQCGDAATAACCNGYCSDTARDPRNCGACGTSCSATQFCTGTKCADAVFANVCENPSATLVWDSYVGDNDAGAEIGQALVSSCSPPITFNQQQNEALAVDPTTGRPLLGVGDTYLIGGGWFGHAGMAYMDKQKLSPVQVNSDGVSYSWIQNLSTSEYVVKILTSSLTATHDYFLLELVVEPESGTLCFAATGMLQPGTTAAGWFASNKVIPNRATYTDAWYAYQWDDTDGSGGPSAGDTFTQLGSGI